MLMLNPPQRCLGINAMDRPPESMADVVAARAGSLNLVFVFVTPGLLASSRALDGGLHLSMAHRSKMGCLE